MDTKINRLFTVPLMQLQRRSGEKLLLVLVVVHYQSFQMACAALPSAVSNVSYADSIWYVSPMPWHSRNIVCQSGSLM